ncbi:Maf-like protein [bacterium]|nr:Maf-like protein [bacterium]
MELILASASPRRRELLSSLGLAFSVVVAEGLDEAAVLQQAYESYAAGAAATPLEQLALLKGEQVARKHPQALVLSADTEVFIDPALAGLEGPGEGQESAAAILPRQHLGKPADRSAAIAMLRLLSGRVHQVDTAVALQCQASGLRIYGTESTLLRFRELTDSEIVAYVDAEHPYDKAGGYAVQEIGDSFVAEMRGEYSNVVGLPLGLTKRLLQEAGFTIWSLCQEDGHQPSLEPLG